jgi:hypothetical protein
MLDSDDNPSGILPFLAESKKADTASGKPMHHKPRAPMIRPSGERGKTLARKQAISDRLGPTRKIKGAYYG